MRTVLMILAVSAAVLVHAPTGPLAFGAADPPAAAPPAPAPAAPAAAPAAQPKNEAAPAPSSEPKSAPAPAPAAPAAAPAPSPEQKGGAAPAAPAPVVEVKAPPRDEFRFQFDGIPYDDIIRRFAQMAGKPLLGEVRVEGSLTFFDSKPYTFDEALGLLNTILQMRGFTLIETARYIQVVPLTGPLSIMKNPAERVFPSPQAAEKVRGDEIVTVMVPLKFVSAEDVVKALQPMVSPFGSLVPAGRGRGVFLTDRMENIRRIKGVLDEIDTTTLAPPGERSLKTYVLKNASARDIATIINNIFGASGLGVGMGATAAASGITPRYIRNPENGEWMRNPEWHGEGEGQRPATPVSDASVKCTADERTNTLFVAGPPDKLAMAEELILKLDEIKPEQTGDMRIFELKNAKAEDVANTLRQILTGAQARPSGYGEGMRYGEGGRSYEGSRYGPQPSQAQGMQARVVADSATNRIIVTAPLDQMNRIEELIKQLDQANIKYVGGIKVFPLKVADAQQLAGVVANALRRAAPQEMTSRGMMAAAGAAQVSADSRTNSLIVAGSASDIQSAETLIIELDRPLEGRDAREIHVIQLKAGDARQVASALMDLLRQQGTEGSSEGYGRYRNGMSSMASNVRVTAEPATNSLLISAAPGDWDTIKKILDQIETSVIPQTTAATRLIPLKFAKASSLAETLNQVYGQSSRGRGGYSSSGGYGGYGRSASPGGAPQVPVVITADERSNMLIVSACEDDQKAIAEIVAKMDVQGAETADQVRIIRLKAGDAVKVAESLRGLYPQGGGGLRGQPASQVFIQGDAASNSLLVRAPDVEFKIIEKMATDLDTTITQTGGIRTFRLKVADAQQLATVLQGALAKRETMGRYGMSTTPQTVVSADTRTNSIIVAGPAADIQTAETLIKELDKPLEEPAREIHVVQLKAGDARQMATALTNLLRQQDATSRYGMSPAGASNIRVEAEAATNSLLISAAPGDWPTIQKILDQLKEAAGPLMVSSTRMITLKHAKASEVAETLRQIFSGGASSPYASGYGRSRMASYGASTTGGQQTVPVVIAASDANNSLLVSASEEDHKTIAELVKAMDVPSAEGVAGIRMIRLESADAVKLAETLKAMIPLPPRGQPSTISIQADPGSNTVLLRAPETDRKMFEEMISSLDKASTQGARETRMISLKFVSAATVAAMLSQLYQAPAASTVSYSSYRRMGAPSAADESPNRVVIAAAPGDRAIVVDAPRDKMEEIARLVAGIDVPGGAGEQQVRTYRLVSAKATDLAPALSRLFTQQQTRMGRPTPSETEIQPRFEADPATNHVIVAATTAQFETIDKLIKELDNATSLARETRTFRLKFAKAADIVDVLQTMLSEAPAAPTAYRGFRGEAAPAAAADVRVAAMPETNDVVVQGPPDKIALAEQLIKTFDAQGAETQTVIQIVQLKNAQASTLADAINATLAEKATPASFSPRRGTRPGGGLGGAGAAAAEPERVTVTPEINSNSVLVRGPAADVPPVVEMIKKLDEGSTSGGAQVRVFPLQNSDPVTLSASLGKLFQEMIRQQSGGGRGQQTIPFSIAADDRTQSLVVTTTPGYFALVEQILKQLDQTEGAPAQDVQYYSLENADATEVASQLTDMYKDRKGLEKPIITADAFSGAVTVIAKDADLKAIEQILSKLDKAAEATSFRVRVIPMTQIKAEKMAEVLKAVYSQMTGSDVNVTDEPSDIKPGAALGPVPVPEIARPAPAAAPPAKSETRPGGPAPAAAEPKGKDRGGSSRERSRGAQGATGVEGETDAPGRAPAPVLFKAPVQKPGVTIGIDKSTNSLIISGKRQDLDYLEALINQLTPSSAQTEAEYRIFKIEKADPTAVARTLDSLFNPRPTLQQLQMQMQGGGGGGRGGQQGGGMPSLPPPSIIAVADVRTSSLIIRAKPLDFELIEPLVKHLDQIPTVASEIRIFTLKNTDATEVAANLRDLFGLNQRQQGQMPQPQAQQQGQGGRPSPQDQRAAMIRQMMELANKGGTTQVDVTAMMSVTANRQTNAVVVAAPTDVMGIVERVIQELDQSGVQGVASVRMYPVKNADVRAMVTALQEIFVTGVRQGGRGAAMGGGMGGPARPAALETPIVVTGDEAGRLVIVLAPADKHEVIAQVIKEMDDAQGMGEVTVRVYHLLNADATTVAPALGSAMERGSAAGAAAVVGGGRGGARAAAAGGGTPGQIRISADRSSNCLVVRATAQDHEKIAQLITEMDTGTEAVVRMYPLKNADVRTTVQALQEIFGAGARVSAAAGGGRRGAAGAAGTAGERGTIVVTGDEAGRLVIVSAPAEKQDLVAKVIKELDDASAAGDVTIKVYRLENADVTTMATALQSTLDRAAAGGGGGRGGAAAAAAPGGAIRISGDRGSNCLVVRSGAADHEKIAKLITEMDVSPTEQFAVRLIPLNNGDAANVATVLQRVFASSGSPAATGARGARGAAGAAAGPGRSPVVIEADRDARMLMVRADDPTFEKIKALAQQLDTASTGRAAPTVIALKFAQAWSVAPALGQAFGTAGRGGAGQRAAVNPDEQVTVVAEPISNSLIVTANAQNLDKVKSLLEKLDTEAAGGVRTELLLLKNARALELAPILQKMTQDGPRGAAGV
ncbi:MAG: hypothetical protein NTX87_15120, partial [Planctomycetota bacterium]|nr:hypothetical protein [Planctomycetota bacterium]